MHGSDDVVHAVQFFRGRVDDDIRALRDRLELVVGQERRDLDDHMPRRVETGHLQVHPGEHDAIVT